MYANHERLAYKATNRRRVALVFFTFVLVKLDTAEIAGLLKKTSKETGEIGIEGQRTFVL